MIKFIVIVVGIIAIDIAIAVIFVAKCRTYSIGS